MIGKQIKEEIKHINTRNQEYIAENNRMTDKQIIKLKPTEDLNEKIIKEKGNTKCIFYSDDICRNGDKTRDCVNCARVKYHSLYSLNWDNQERLQKIIKQKEQELQKAMDNYVQLDLQRVKEYNELVDLYKAKEQECEQEKALKETYLACYKTKHEDIEGALFKLKQTFAEIKPILEFYANSNMGEEQPDKTYHIMLNGSYIMVYDPKPARQALQKISEVKNEN